MAVRSLEVKLQIEWQSAKQKGTSATGWMWSINLSPLWVRFSRDQTLSKNGPRGFQSASRKREDFICLAPYSGYDVDSTILMEWNGRERVCR